MSTESKTFKIVISVLIALIILTLIFFGCLFFILDRFAIIETDYNIFIAGVAVTAMNKDDILGDGTVAYSPQYNILYFNGANIETDQSVIATTHDIGICLSGENKFTSTADGYIPLIYSSDYLIDNDIYIYGDGSLTVEYVNDCSDSGVIQCGSLSVHSDITITAPNCTNITNGIVCGKDMFLRDGATVTVNLGAAKHSMAVRVRGTLLMEYDTAINVVCAEGGVEMTRGIHVNGDFVIYDGSSVNVTMQDTTANTVECIRVNGLFELGSDCSVTATTAKGHAVECYGSIKLADGSTLTATSASDDADIIAYGAFVNYGTTVTGDIEALGGTYDKSND